MVHRTLLIAGKRPRAALKCNFDFSQGTGVVDALNSVAGPGTAFLQRDIDGGAAVAFGISHPCRAVAHGQRDFGISRTPTFRLDVALNVQGSRFIGRQRDLTSSVCVHGQMIGGNLTAVRRRN